ncbi:hypothetical protein [Bosea sp. TAF32]|uniref:hypothetical protein n=1 Tax=Bosea sp. TAF32 TaxID=3237482 RepID=UPI003F8E3E5A
MLVEAVSQGLLQASPSLLNPEDRGKTPGLALAVIDADLNGLGLPAGATAQVAVYLVPIAVVRRVLLRMKSWLNYIV